MEKNQTLVPMSSAREVHIPRVNRRKRTGEAASAGVAVRQGAARMPRSGRRAKPALNDLRRRQAPRYGIPYLCA
jgi:hypothetical protein